MPDNILIDDYHLEKAHIHPNSDKHYMKEEINETDLITVFNIVHNHIDNNKGLKLNKLIKELKK
ncbi:hypothetical protein [Methanobrevibacter filiformis]|uniref:Uncharacterized protein n=1 Tax=Methanobrevibacter filiformis TaxID=55758 RepID=A0A166AEY9_9EURY|nr:hypothetical protein [Methanobrevibacter filiformis]KZX11944.1 hypothetical protein MBFIL_12820 [Methanobrevibacter filiformis]